MDYKFNPREYWEKRLKSNLDLQGVGHHRFDLEYNKRLYAAQKDCMDILVDRCHLPITDKHIIDIGSGTGFYLEYYEALRPASLTGVDITQCSIEYLQKKFPNGRFFQQDIAEKNLQMSEKFDIVSAMGVLYHIVEEDKFSQAVTNLCQLLNPGGFVIISDTFRESYIPSARHAHFRGLNKYQGLFADQQVKITEIISLYYLLNRSFLPFIGSRIIDFFRLGKPFYLLDKKLRSLNWPNWGNLKILVGQKM